MKNFTLLLLLSFGISHAQTQKVTINALLDNWHKAAAEAQPEPYFAALAPDAVYIGTDATENWNVDQFRAFAAPYFKSGKTWNFKALERHIYLNAANDMAWFDELLDTQMKICRGSGVLRKEKDGWKIVHYVLSMTVPNDNIDSVIKVKAPIEDALIKTLEQKK